MGIAETCSRLIGDLVSAIGGGVSRSSSAVNIDQKPENASKVDDSMARALITVFGMQNNGRIQKEKARQVVENLGLIRLEEEDESTMEVFELSGGDDAEVAVEEVLGGLEEEVDGSKRNELLLEAFKVFDEDGNGFIEAGELKRVLKCLGLDNGWEMDEIHKMLRVVDLNLDGKVDFGEFELMMGVKSH
ncbi:hypothetical protein UlMin_034990 [Ulmus minor]